MKQLVETQAPSTSSISAVQKSKKCQKCGTSHTSKPRNACPAYGAKCYACGRMITGGTCARTSHTLTDSKSHRHKSKENSTDTNRNPVNHPQEVQNTIILFKKRMSTILMRSCTIWWQPQEMTVMKYSQKWLYASLAKKHRNTSILAKVDTSSRKHTAHQSIQEDEHPSWYSSPINNDAHSVQWHWYTARWKGWATVQIQRGGMAERSILRRRHTRPNHPRPPVMQGTTPRIPALCRPNHFQVSQTHSAKVPRIFSIYSEQFDRIGHFPGKYHIVLDPHAEPVMHAPQKCPIHLREELKAELQKMVEDDVIKKVDEPTAWVSSLTYSRKANGQLRICLDPKDLNRAIRRCHTKAPTLEELTHSFTGAKFFSKMDAKNGYWAVELDEESQLLTTFNSPFSRYCYKRMPFGLVMSQDVYQSCIDQIVEQCPGVIGIADDMVVYGQTEEEHDRNLLNLMEVAKKSGLVFNSQKCGIKLPEIKFFGHIYDQNGARPDPTKVEDIRALPAPQTKQQLQEFLGMVTYLAPFISHLSQNTAALHDLLKRESEFQWNASHQEAFTAVKEAISEETTLSYFNPKKDTTIQVDASSKGLGAVLLQEGRPIAFASKSLTEAEQRYANIEREVLAVVFGCKRFHTYVYASKFTIESDHKPLEMISAKNITCAPPRLQRMFLEVQGYDFNIKYRPGKEIMLADGLSRLPNRAKNKEINLDIKIQFVQFAEDKMTQLRRESRRDTTLDALQEVIVEGWPKKRTHWPTFLRQFWTFRDEISVCDTLVLKGDRIFIPEVMRESILSRLHSSHQGIEKTRLRARTSVYWPGIDADIENVIRECETCQDHQRSQQKETLIQHEIPSPAELLHSRKLKSNLPMKSNYEYGDKDKVYEHLAKRQEKQKEYHDRAAHDLPQLFQGQPVYVQHHQTGPLGERHDTRKARSAKIIQRYGAQRQDAPPES